MAGKIQIDSERCKGCGLCVIACPKGGIIISKKANKCGFFPAEDINRDCNGCAMCAIVCPDVAIEVSRGSDIKETAAAKKDASETSQKCQRK